MVSFIGHEIYAIDHKGRVAIPQWGRNPSSAKKAITTFFLNRGFEGCINVHDPDGWNRLMASLRRIPPGDARGRAFQRAFLMDAKEVTVDAQGRVPIPPALLRHAGIGKEAVLHGNNVRIEIWNPETWAKHVGPVTDVPGEYERLGAEYLKDALGE
jgi:MraZ protein